MVPRKTSQLCQWRKPSADSQGKHIQFCFIWCFNLYSGHLFPHYSDNAALKARRENGYGRNCWNQGNPPCRTGICSICEKGAGSCAAGQTSGIGPPSASGKVQGVNTVAVTPMVRAWRHVVRGIPTVPTFRD